MCISCFGVCETLVLVADMCVGSPRGGGHREHLAVLTEGARLYDGECVCGCEGKKI